MRERISPKDFTTGAPPRIMGTEAEDHISRSHYQQDRLSKSVQDREAITALLSNTNLKRAKIDVVDDGYESVWLLNGQSIYRDGAMLESCTAENLGPRKTLAGTLAGIKKVQKLADASKLPLHIFRRTATVGPGGVQKAGFHINHIAPKDIFNRIDDDPPALRVHSATRLYTWAGMVAPDGFQLSQKAHAYGHIHSFYRRKCTLSDRDFGFNRLEDYSADDSSPWGTFMAMATTSVLLRVLEHRELRNLNTRLNAMTLADPRTAIQTVSTDTTLRETIPLADGRSLTAIDIQSELADIALEFGKVFKLPEDEQYAVEQWQIICRDLKEAAKTDDIRPLAGRIGWASKKLWLERKNIGPLQADNPEAVLFDMDWDCFYPKEGGRLTYPKRTGLTIATDAEVMDLVDNPPQDTRAALRSKYMKDPELIIRGVYWDNVKVYSEGKERKINLHPYQTS